jgi:hypothetical protein
MKSSHVFGYYHHAGSILIQPMNNSRPAYPANSLDARTVMQQRIHDSPTRASRGRMDHHAGRFVNHNAILVLVENIQGQRLGFEFRIACWQRTNIDPVV